MKSPLIKNKILKLHGQFQHSFNRLGLNLGL